MSIHNVLALTAARRLVHLVNGDPDWRQAFTSTSVSLGYLRSGVSWPIPDAVLVDGDDPASTHYCALEFKPPGSSKSECVRGLGQATTYLTSYDSAAIILPDRADDGFRIADYFGDLLSEPVVAQENIGIYSYPLAQVGTASPGSFPLHLVKPVGQLAAATGSSAPPSLERTFWAFWRDASLHEYFTVLDKADRLSGQADTREASLAHLYQEYSGLRTVDPQGNPRTSAGISASHFTGNTAVTLSHMRLWNPDGTLTSAGRRLVHLGRLFGHTSAPFRDAFARQALLEGRHFEFVKLVYEFQSRSHGTYRRADEFAAGLEAFLEDEGLLKRLPRRRTTGSRRFLKAELTFWGVILRIIRKRGRSYVVPGVGLDFDWARILDLIASNDVGRPGW